MIPELNCEVIPQAPGLAQQGSPPTAGVDGAARHFPFSCASRADRTSQTKPTAQIYSSSSSSSSSFCNVKLLLSLDCGQQGKGYTRPVWSDPACPFESVPPSHVVGAELE